MNQYRQNPKLLAKRLEMLRTYLDPETNILSEPNKIQIQMVEGDAVFKESINYLKNLSPLEPLEWDDNLAASAMEHVTDIGPKGLLLYQSSDGTEPEDRITKYGSYSESLGENIDFGPNDAVGVIISLTLDDGEEQRPHRDNLFKADYHKVGIACGPHKTEFQMCVMDFAFDFFPSNNNKNNKGTANNNAQNNMRIQMNKNDILNNSNYGPGSGANQTTTNQSPYVKLSLESDDFSKMNLLFNNNQQQGNKVQNNVQAVQNYNNKKNNQNPGVLNNMGGNDLPNNNEIEEMSNRTKNLLSGLKVREKKVEIVTKIIYTYEDGSTREVVQTQRHSFK